MNVVYKSTPEMLKFKVFYDDKQGVRNYAIEEAESSALAAQIIRRKIPTAQIRKIKEQR